MSEDIKLENGSTIKFTGGEKEKLRGEATTTPPLPEGRDEALEAVGRIEDAFVSALKTLNIKEGMERVLEVSEDFESLRAILSQPSVQSAVDVEGLKKELIHPTGDPSIDEGNIYKDGWNDCIDHLVSQGHITPNNKEEE